MQGNPDQPGLIPMAVDEIFDLISNDADRQYLLRVSYIEL
jgi:centromeric protein E